jgi:hypothetical protein
MSPAGIKVEGVDAPRAAAKWLRRRKPCETRVVPEKLKMASFCKEIERYLQSFKPYV